MKTKILILTILAALSLGCMQTALDGVKQRAIRDWGPEENWTQQQRWAFLVVATQMVRDEHELAVARASQPVYQPVIPYTQPYVSQGSSLLGTTANPVRVQITPSMPATVPYISPTGPLFRQFP